MPPHLGFISAPYSVGGLHQLDRLQSRARQVNLQTFGTKGDGRAGHNSSTWPARNHHRGQVIRPLHRSTSPSSPTHDTLVQTGLLAAKLPRVPRHTSEARMRRRMTFRLLSNTVDLKAGGHGTTMVVAVAAAGRTGRHVRQHVPVRQSGRARAVSQRRRRPSSQASTE